jgi:hypothetical protein
LTIVKRERERVRERERLWWIMSFRDDEELSLKILKTVRCIFLPLHFSPTLPRYWEMILKNLSCPLQKRREWKVQIHLIEADMDRVILCKS